jgi:arylsulfatase A-like enzyme
MDTQRAPHLLVAILAAFLTASCGGSKASSTAAGRAISASQGPRPNIVFITCDTLRADRLGAYGSTETRTPELDALAARGVRFERAYATLPKTNPALSSMMTGRYPSAHGVRRNGAHLPESELTLAEILQAAGYNTAAFVSNHVMAARHGLAQGFLLYDENLPDAIPTRQAQERIAGHLVDAVLAWTATRPAGPLFLWVHFIDPHGPYTPPGYKDRAVASSPTGRSIPVSRTDDGMEVIPAYQALPGVTQVDDYVARYDLEVEYMDSQVGRLVRGLEAGSILKDAVVLFAADHGESMGEHGFYFQHGSSLYESQIHIPLILFGSGIDARVEESPISSVDVMPTVLEMAGVSQPRGIQGTSLVRLLTAAGASSSGGAEGGNNGRILFAELGKKFAAIQGTRKLIWDGGARELDLLDVAADPDESHNLSGSSPEEGRRLFESVARFTRENTRDEAPATDAETLKTLKSLGYVE